MEWVAQAVSDAKQSLRDAEVQLQQSFGSVDPVQQQQGYNDDHREDVAPDSDNDATSWQ
jgi:hypothetical protein